jgi:hypothetical protein
VGDRGRERAQGRELAGLVEAVAQAAVLAGVGQPGGELLRGVQALAIEDPAGDDQRAVQLGAGAHRHRQLGQPAPAIAGAGGQTVAQPGVELGSRHEPRDAAVGQLAERASRRGRRHRGRIVVCQSAGACRVEQIAAPGPTRIDAALEPRPQPLGDRRRPRAAPPPTASAAVARCAASRRPALPAPSDAGGGQQQPDHHERALEQAARRRRCAS